MYRPTTFIAATLTLFAALACQDDAKTTDAAYKTVTPTSNPVASQRICVKRMRLTSSSAPDRRA